MLNSNGQKREEIRWELRGPADMEEKCGHSRPSEKLMPGRFCCPGCLYCTGTSK